LQEVYSPKRRKTRSFTKVEETFLEENETKKEYVPPVKKRKEVIQPEILEKVSKISVFKDLKPLPIFYPTKEDFEDFKSYILKIHKESMEYGSCRIVPPKDWFEI
jgi:hypothetical protein